LQTGRGAGSIDKSPPPPAVAAASAHISTKQRMFWLMMMAFIFITESPFCPIHNDLDKGRGLLLV
jgi:hypothetical protein